MIKVFLTANLQKYYPVSQFEADAGSLSQLLAIMDAERPQFSSYIVEESGTVRKHVNVFVNGKLIPKMAAGREIPPGSEVHIMQALSGG